MAETGLTALLLNRREDRLKQSGLIIISASIGRCIMLGQTPMSVRLRSDFERAGEYNFQGTHGKKTAFWLPNKLASFFEAAQGYYAFGGYSLWRQSLGFEPKIGEPVFITDDFFVTNDSNIGVEAVTIVT